MRWLPWLAGLVLVAGVVSFVVVHFNNTAKPLPEKRSGPVERAPNVVEKTVPLQRAARIVAGEFILKAVSRKDAVAAYRLSGPYIRGGETLKQWVRDWDNPNVGVPIVPFTKPIMAAPIKVDVSHPRHAEIEVALVPKTKGQAQLFLMMLDKIGGRWFVNYFASRESPEMPAPE